MFIYKHTQGMMSSCFLFVFVVVAAPNCAKKKKKEPTTLDKHVWCSGMSTNQTLRSFFPLLASLYLSRLGGPRRVCRTRELARRRALQMCIIIRPRFSFSFLFSPPLSFFLCITVFSLSVVGQQSLVNWVRVFEAGIGELPRKCLHLLPHCKHIPRLVRGLDKVGELR